MAKCLKESIFEFGYIHFALKLKKDTIFSKTVQWKFFATESIIVINKFLMAIYNKKLIFRYK